MASVAREGLDHTVQDSALLRRIADTVAIMLYELEVLPDGSLHCHEFIGLDALIGKVPPGVSPDDAYDAAIHEDDRDLYERGNAALAHGQAVEIEYRLVGSDGTERWVLDRMRPHRAADGRLIVGGVVADITERKATEAELARARELAKNALHDPLTGLANRSAIQEHLDLAIARAKRNDDGIALLYIDLDDFKLINDSFGHGAGDELLRDVSSRLLSAVRSSDVVARQGGDEFLILLADLGRGGVAGALGPGALASQAETVATKLRGALRTPFLLDGLEIYLSASVGISLYPTDAPDASTLLKHADVAMYSVKEGGRDGHAVYARDSDTGLEQVSAVSRLHRTLQTGEGLELYYQPLVTLPDERIVGAEALLRWHDGDRGIVSPGQFIPLAERVGLMGAISDWVIEHACLQAGSWMRAGHELYVSLNLPPSYCQSTGMAYLEGCANFAGVPLSRLMIEITESALLPNSRRPLEDIVAEAASNGLKLAIDDFGTGYSTLGRLNQNWVDTLKIDRSFITGLGTDVHARDLVAAMIHLARTLKLEPLAEGIETTAQKRLLVELGCTHGQGFLFSRPVPAAEFEQLLA
jgi:diguanylate cyclase (GGDEF)-like protein